jgi:hypothetical protein
MDGWMDDDDDVWWMRVATWDENKSIMWEGDYTNYIISVPFTHG